MKPLLRIKKYGLVVLLLTAGLMRLGAEVFHDVAYGTEAGTPYEVERLKLDLYIPDDAASGFSTVVWFHGGSLKTGDKAGDIARGLAERLGAHGIAVASVNYRLNPRVVFPAYVEDAAKAVAWVIRHVNDYGGNPRSVFVSGHSAGGYLTAMVGMDSSYLEAMGMPSTDVAGCIPVAGQMITHSTVREERGIPPTQPIVDAAAPVFHVRSPAPPFLNIVADNDLPARREENAYFVAARHAAGQADTSLLVIQNRNHGTVAAKIAEENDPALQAIIAFILRHRP